MTMMSGAKVRPTDMEEHPGPFNFKEIPGSMASLHYAEVAEQAEDVGSAPPDGVSPEARWIKNNIYMRVCKIFVKNNPDEPFSNNSLCKCGHKKKDHISPLEFGQDGTWNVEHNTVKKPTNTFGEIEFIGHGENERKYIRVDVNTSMDKMQNLMMNVWGLEKPNLLISVTGGANFFNMKAKLKEAFRRGLINAARSTGAWIVTGGTNTGVMKHVGEAVRDYGLTATSGAPVVAIGVATWGCIHKKQDLISQGNGLYPAQYRVSTEKIKVKKEAYLDPNHTHFILVDNGTEHQFAVEIPFRAKLENTVANMKTDTGKDAVKVPVCLLVLEGGPGTLETVHQSILNNIPIIIVQGSGRAADILAMAYHCSKEKETKYKDKMGHEMSRMESEFDSTQEAKILDVIKETFTEKNLTKNWQMVKESLVNRDLVTVFDLNTPSTNLAHRDIDYAILKALLKANKDQVYDQLKLALAWNRIDIAKSEIFLDDRTWQAGSLDDILQSAIMLNRRDFIELILDNGVSLKDFLTLPRLVQLYNQIPQKCHLALMLRRIKDKYNSEIDAVTLCDVGYLIQNLIGDFYASHHLSATDVSQGVGMMLLKASSSTHKDGSKFNAIQELFFWSVLMNRQELAKLFWNLGKDAIAGALVAYGLLTKMSRKTEDVELQKSFLRNAREFSDLALEVLNECHETDERKAQDLLIRQLDNWGGATCILIAVETENKHFISQTACQSLLNRVWMGRLSNENGAFRLLGCVLCPYLIFPFIKYLEEEKKDHSTIVPENDPVDKGRPFKDDGKHPGMMRRETQMSFQKNIHQEEKPPGISVPRKLYYFYTSPVIIFIHNVIAYLIFLTLFSYLLLVELASTVSVIEIILMVWVFSIFAEEVRQFLNPHYAQRMKVWKKDGLYPISTITTETRYLVMSSSATVKTKIRSYLSEYWNLVDVLTIVLFVCALLLRSMPFHSTLEAARVVYAVNFVTFFFRILHIFSVHRELGPKLVMIGKMLYDLSYFMVILMVFVVSYAVASYSVLYPNTELSAESILKVMRMSYWNLYGELFMEEIELEEPNCSFDPTLYNNGTLPRCPSEVGRYSTPIFMGIYVLFANILLLNLLIAMFSFSIQKIQDETDQHWNFQRYVLIYEYYSKPPLPTPFILISHIYLFFRWLCHYCTSCCIPNHQSDLIKRFSNERELVQWENVIADSYLHRLEMKEFDKLDMKVQLTHDRLDTLLIRMDTMHDVQHPNPNPTVPMPAYDIQPVVKMPPQLEKRLKTLEDQMQTMTESLNWIVNTMKKNKAGMQVTYNIDPVKKKEEEMARKQEESSKYIQSMINHQSLSQTKSRNAYYPGSSVKRFPVPEEKAQWSIPWSEYNPVYYEAPEVTAKPYWADIDLMKLSPKDRIGKIKFNQYDEQCNYNRISYLGTYEIIDGIPRNPKVRTGIVGRGLLGRWGPNHAGDPIVTRWKRDDKGKPLTRHGKKVFEFVAIIRTDNKLNSLPGGMVEPGQDVHECLKAEFKEEALGNLIHDEQHKKTIRDRLKTMFEEGELVCKGYADDPRNTDNSWMETLVYHYHDDTGEILHPFDLRGVMRAGETVDAVSWMTASENLTLHAAHAYYIKLVAKKLDAAF